MSIIIFKTGTELLPEGRHLVKVQISITTGHRGAVAQGRKSVMVYNESRSLFFERIASEKIMQKMGGKLKKYFWAEVKNGKFILSNIERTSPLKW